MRRLLPTISLFALAATAFAREFPAPVSLPVVLPDNLGNRWDVQHDGTIGDGGNNVYDAGGRLFLDNQTLYRPVGPATLDRERNEIALAPYRHKGLLVSRRVAVNREVGFVRWAEVIENPTAAKVTLQLRIQFDLGGFVQQSQLFMDPKLKRPLGATAGDQRHTIAVVAAGRDSKLAPRVEPRQGSDQIDLFYSLEIPPRQTLVVVHAQSRRSSVSEGTSFIAETKEREFLATLPSDLRKLVANFRVTGDKSIGGDHELLRGETTDLLELRVGPSGDRTPDLLRGRLADRALSVRTAYGDFTFAAEDVVGLLNLRAVTPRQLLVTKSGEVYFGTLSKETIGFEMAGGRVVEVPLEAVSRLGCRPREGEPEFWKLDGPMAILRAGDRVNVFPPPGPVEFSTRFGTLSLSPELVSSIDFVIEDAGAHRAFLRDGSRITGLVGAGAFDLRLTGEASQRNVRLPASSFDRLQFAPQGDPTDPANPVLEAANGDVLVGVLEGTVYVDTAYDAIVVDCGEIKRMSYTGNATGGGGDDVEVVLWDDTLVRGQLREGEVKCRLLSGLVVTVPAPLVGQYTQPRPSPSAHVQRNIEALIDQLGADDWRQRMRAQTRLRQIGPIAIRRLKDLYPTLSPEAQQRVEMILPEIEARGLREQSLRR